MRYKPMIAVIAAFGVAAAVAAFSLLRESTVDGEPFTIPTATDADLQKVAESRVVFAHQSVGFNMMDAVAGIYADAGIPAPTVEQTEATPTSAEIMHIEIGENGDPLGKIAEFDSIMRSGMADVVDVAILKLCYIDFRVGTDVQPIFDAYHDTVTALAADYPGVAFIAATAPLTTERGPLGKLKGMIGQGDKLGPEHNVVREQFNKLIRAEYSGSGELFDIAAIQSTNPDGDRMGGTHDGQPYFAMAKEYASDPGHLNFEGAAVVTSAFLAVVADAINEQSAVSA